MAPDTAGIVLELAAHRRRTAELLERLDHVRAAPVTQAPLLSHLAEQLRRTDTRLEDLVARLGR